MGKCLNCGTEGPFVRVDDRGLCVFCRRRAETSAARRINGTADFGPVLDPEAVITRYVTTFHNTYPSQYGVVEYYTAEFDCMLASLPRAPISPCFYDAPAREAECVYLRKPGGSSLGDYRNFVAIDTETSGLGRRAEIVEVSAVRFSDFRPVAIYTSLCKPYGRISSEATAVHGISDGDVRFAPRFAQILPGLESFVGKDLLVAHNAPFDMKILAEEGFDTYGRAVFDTLPLARSILRDSEGNKLKSYRLSDSCRACAVLFSGAHRSSADALAAGLLFLELLKRHFGRENLRNP